MNCSIVLFRKSYYFYGIWVFILLRNINLTVLKIGLKTVPKFSKNSSESIVSLWYIRNNDDLWDDELFWLEKLAKIHLDEMK